MCWGSGCVCVHTHTDGKREMMEREVCESLPCAYIPHNTTRVLLASESHDHNDFKPKTEPNQRYTRKGHIPGGKHTSDFLTDC